MNRWISKGGLGALGIVGCVVWTGCGGGGGMMPGARNLSFVRTADNPSVIHLNWTPPPVKSLLGYSVRRRRAGESTYNLVTNRLLQETSYTDRLPESTDTRTFFYQVIAVGENGKLSAPAEIAA